MSWIKQTPDPELQPNRAARGDFELRRPVPCGGPGHTGELTIEAGVNFNGSGKKYFGGAESWPHVTLRMPFRTGDEVGQRLFVEALQDFLDTWILYSGEDK